ncbi:MAG: hypothetical protein U0R80_09030 [Nocardioidaceae bacterium]
MSLVVLLVRLLPLHFGALHPFETVLAVVLAVAPFLVLFAVILVRRRQDIREEEAAGEERGRLLDEG